MRRIIILTVVILALITFSGCKKNTEVNNENISANQEAGSSSKKTETVSNGVIDTIDKIKSALGANKSMECTYSSSENDLNLEMKTYMQGEKYKTEFLVDGKKNYSVFDGKISYSWEEGSSQGIKIDIACLESLNMESQPAGTEDDATVEVKEETEDIFDGAQNVNCKVTGEIDFSVPQNVNFIDQCEMLKNQQKLINDLNGQVPAGLPKF